MRLKQDMAVKCLLILLNIQNYPCIHILKNNFSMCEKWFQKSENIEYNLTFQVTNITGNNMRERSFRKLASIRILLVSN